MFVIDSQSSWCDGDCELNWCSRGVLEIVTQFKDICTVLIVTAQYACNLRSFQVFDFGLLWSWIRIGFQTRCMDIQVVAIASLTTTFYSCSLVTSLSCMTVAARCILCLKLTCRETNEMCILVIITQVWWAGLGRLTTWSAWVGLGW